MGTGISVAVEAEADSPSEPGMKSILSAPLDEFCDYQSFFEAIIPLLKDPLSPYENFVVKTRELKETSPDEFTVKIVHDGKKLQRYSAMCGLEDLTRGGADVVRLWTRVECHREERQIVCTEYAEDGAVRAMSYTRFLEEPFRVEVWRVMANGERRANSELAATVRDGFVNPILNSLANRKVLVKHSVQSPSGGGECALSGSLDEFCVYDDLFDLTIEVLKESAVRDSPDTEVAEIAADQFEMTSNTPMVGDRGSSATMSSLVKHDRDKGEIVVVASLDEELLYTSFICIHLEPLRIAHWIESGGQRLGGRAEGIKLQAFVDSITYKSEGGWFW